MTSMTIHGREDDASDTKGAMSATATSTFHLAGELVAFICLAETPHLY